MKIPTSDLTETLTITRKTGEGAYGAVYGEAREVAAALDWGFRKVINEKGEEVIASGIACVRDEEIQIGDEVLWNRRRFVVIDVQPILDRKHIHHYEIALQSGSE